MIFSQNGQNTVFFIFYGFYEKEEIWPKILRAHLFF